MSGRYLLDTNVQDLKVKGQPIPENDIWIAAIAQHHSLILVTNDAHFDSIDNLTVEKW